ncbi:PAQR family membrane homeostasis protein TrhA [Dubosiella newyorkensis]|jgi:hemolysin III|uniref:Hemolysin III n=1 Tax=Dubosiella newyorkensis TaxID=1862672 RepID=A0A1U7NNJ1_9FIRM|nr:hemolysin III family protein [Dubosiella newyorkensis]OLU46902.1 hemolysin III [Dubosiella newyorkensis]
MNKNTQEDLMKNSYPLSFGEEIGNSVSHGVMALILLFTLPYYAIRSYLMGGSRVAIGISIYFFCMFFMFAGSCLYHAMKYGTFHKYVFRKLDHIMILLAIAGTYTPICLIVLPNWIGYTILAIEWLMVLAGVLLKSISNKKHKVLSMTIYMVMGWMAIFILPSLMANTNWIFMTLLVTGGILYTIGAFFYAHPEKNFFHFTWHILIVLASICHLIAILYFL